MDHQTVTESVGRVWCVLIDNGPYEAASLVDICTSPELAAAVIAAEPGTPGYLIAEEWQVSSQPRPDHDDEGAPWWCRRCRGEKCYPHEWCGTYGCACDECYRPDLAAIQRELARRWPGVYD